jgi:hypothetical protein
MTISIEPAVSTHPVITRGALAKADYALVADGFHGSKLLFCAEGALCGIHAEVTEGSVPQRRVIVSGKLEGYFGTEVRHPEGIAPGEAYMVAALSDEDRIQDRITHVQKLRDMIGRNDPRIEPVSTF